MKGPIIIALDFPSGQEVQRFLQLFNNEPLFLKIGMELYYQEGPAIIALLKEQNHKVFLDLKLHDIPNTVNRAMKGLARLDIDMVNVHAAGGREMMKAALEGLEAGTGNGRERPKCIAVTQLTSTSQEQMQKEQLIPVTIEESVIHYAALAQEAGLDGVVCSTLEAGTIRERFGPYFLTVTPGIRLSSNDAQDQKRIATPERARALGVSAIVVGRPVTQAKDPVESYYMIKQAWEGELR
ncbi:MAG TPA: orotidine-5'-phosphate decarboxylase [Clostridiales bacterium]|nr:orotidine-5'-phosphate decarboxylase [Clostridiales bacterium]